MESFRVFFHKLEEVFLPERNQQIILLAILLVFFGSTLFNGFVHDDRAAIVTNEYLHSGQYWYKTFAGCMGEYQLGGCEGKGFYYRPIKLFSDFIAYRISSSPWIFHFFNLAYTYALCLVLLRFYAFFLKNRILAFLGVLLFLTHPINTEVINWIAAVQDILVALFLVLSLKWYLRHIEGEENGALMKAGLFWLAAMFSKETAVFFGAILIGCELFQKRRASIVLTTLLKNYRLILFYTVPILVYFTFRYAVLGTFFANDYARTTEHLPASTHTLTSLWLYGVYLFKLIWPHPLNLFHSINTSQLPSYQITLSGLALLASLVPLFVFFKKQYAVPFLGLLWWIVLIAPSIIFIGSLGNNVLYERYVFVPLVGLILAFLYGVQQLLERHKLFFQRPAVMAIVIVVVLVYILAAWRIDTNRNRDFRDNISLYTSAIALSPNEVDLYYNLALSYAEAKDTPNAVSNYHRVLELEPQNYKAHNNLGSIYLASDNLIAAEREYQFAIELNPSLFSSYYNLASVYIKLNDRDRALAALEKALELNPNFTQAKQRRELLLKEDDRTSDNYFRGRKGEDTILEELKKLPDEFRVYCDVKIQHPYNIDFLVTGPTGIFAIEVKSHVGEIGYENGRITINGFVPKEKDFLRQAKGEAGSVSDYLKEKVSKDYWVSPVLAFSNPKTTMHFGLKPVDDVFIVGKGFLLSLLQSGERQLSEDKLSELESALSQTI